MMSKKDKTSETYLKREIKRRKRKCTVKWKKRRGKGEDNSG